LMGITKKEVIKYKRQLFIRSLKDYWFQFQRRKMGFLGLCIIIFFFLLAAAAPLLTPYDPIRDDRLAEPTAPPAWLELISPAHKGLPKTTVYAMAPEGFRTVVYNSSGTFHVIREKETLVVRYIGGSRGKSWISLLYTIDYPYRTLRTFIIEYRMDVSNMQDYDIYEDLGIRVARALYIVEEKGGREYILYTKKYRAWVFGDLSEKATIYSTERELLIENKFHPLDNLAEKIFRGAGRYTVKLNITIHDNGAKYPDAPREVVITLRDVKLEVKGMLHGLLGTTYQAQDVWSQFVWGSRISLTVGFLVAAILLIIAVPLGLAAGYSGRIADRILISLFDLIIILPALPLVLLAIMVMRGANIYVTMSIIALLGWGGTARQVRAWVLSLKERAFIESAKAIGASSSYIMFRYILPQIAPLLLYYVTVILPGAIMTEAGVSLLGFGDIRVSSWGQMINQAWNGAAYYAWWWLGPPILGITILAMGCVFVGYTLDEIANPKLRRR